MYKMMNCIGKTTWDSKPQSKIIMIFQIISSPKHDMSIFKSVLIFHLKTFKHELNKRSYIGRQPQHRKEPVRTDPTINARIIVVVPEDRSINVTATFINCRTSNKVDLAHFAIFVMPSNIGLRSVGLSAKIAFKPTYSTARILCLKLKFFLIIHRLGPKRAGAPSCSIIQHNIWDSVWSRPYWRG